MSCNLLSGMVYLYQEQGGDHGRDGSRGQKTPRESTLPNEWFFLHLLFLSPQGFSSFSLGALFLKPDQAGELGKGRGNLFPRKKGIGEKLAQLDPFLVE